MDMVWIPFLWIVFALIVGAGASNRGRSGFGWFLLALILSPLLAGFALVVVGARPRDPDADYGSLRIERPEKHRRRGFFGQRQA